MITNGPDERRDAERMAAAAGLARRHGRLSDTGLVDAVRLSRGNATCVLLDQRGQPLARLPMAAVEAQMRRRRRRLQRLIASPRRHTGSGAGWRDQLRLRPARERALAWALSTHRIVPQPVFDSEALLLLAVLLLLGILPGLIYLFFLLRQHRRADLEMRDLVNRWKIQARPDPSLEGVEFLLASGPGQAA
jgi:hypothetical protein